jgi:hypothetical protein
MPETVCAVKETIVVDKVPIARVVRRINVDTLDSARMGHAQKTQSIEVVSFDD